MGKPRRRDDSRVDRNQKATSTKRDDAGRGILVVRVGTSGRNSSTPLAGSESALPNQTTGTSTGTAAAERGSPADHIPRQPLHGRDNNVDAERGTNVNEVIPPRSARPEANLNDAS